MKEIREQIQKVRTQIDHQSNVGNTSAELQLIDDLTVAFESLLDRLDGKTIKQRLEEFRRERIDAVIVGKEPIQTPIVPKVLLHVIPEESLVYPQEYNVATMMQSQYSNLYPLGSSGYDDRILYDGLLTYRSYQGESDSRHYNMLYKNGINETVDAITLDSTHRDGQKFIPITHLEESVINAVRQRFDLLQSLGIQGKVYVALTLLEVDGFTIYLDPSRRFSDLRDIERNYLVINEVVTDNLQTDVDLLLRPVFNSIWHACNLQGSLNYDPATGRWSKRV